MLIFEQLKGGVKTIRPLLNDYKEAIGEDRLSANQLRSLEAAVAVGDIMFFVARSADNPVAMCSVTRTFSTFRCQHGGVFEDFYVVPEYRKGGLAKKLTEYVLDYCKNIGIRSLWVGCADCDMDMYRHLGFEMRLGNLLTWHAE